MKLRIAKKICKAMTEDGYSGLRHTAQQQQAAANRYCKMKSSKQGDKFWNQLMNFSVLKVGQNCWPVAALEAVQGERS